MYPSEIREMWYKNKQNSTCSVRTGTNWYATRKVCTFSVKYVLLSWFLCSVRTKYVLYLKVRTWYVYGVNSTISKPSCYYIRFFLSSIIRIKTLLKHIISLLYQLVFYSFWIIKTYYITSLKTAIISLISVLLYQLLF